MASTLTPLERQCESLISGFSLHYVPHSYDCAHINVATSIDPAARLTRLGHA